MRKPVPAVDFLRRIVRPEFRNQQFDEACLLVGILTLFLLLRIVHDIIEPCAEILETLPVIAGRSGSSSQRVESEERHALGKVEGWYQAGGAEFIHVERHGHMCRRQRLFRQAFRQNIRWVMIENPLPVGHADRP